MANECQTVVLLDNEAGDTNGHSEKIVEERSRRRRREGHWELRKKNPSKKPAIAPIGQKEMQELIRQCEYEVIQDPYRGIGFMSNRKNEQENHGEKRKMNNTDRDEMKVDLSSRKKKLNKIITPWDICQWGILSMPTCIEARGGQQQKPDFSEMDIGNVQTSDSFPLNSSSADNLVRNLTESRCPSIIAWTKHLLEEESKAKKQPQKTRKQRSIMGRKRKRPCSDDDVKNYSIFPCSGTRPSDPKYQCPCDWNPFCLGSMGGVINDLLKERIQKDIAISIMDEDESSGNVNDLAKKNSAKTYECGSDCSNTKSKNKKSNKAEIEIVDQIVTEIEPEESGGLLAFVVEKTTSLSFRGKEKKIEAESKENAIVTCSRLGPRRSQPKIGDPAEVYSPKNDFSDHYIDEKWQSQKTKDEIHKLRGFEKVDVSKIKKFVKSVLKLSCESNATAMTTNKYIQALTDWHKSLVFTNPFTEERASSNDSITIALPPGIQNLGATCYLNTQLQCLAQNPVFLDGIFSWRPVNATHKMNGVMTKLQKLLAQMVVGSDCKYTSLDFSNALGIQHNEQQDPNEFARLLFDRMEESFQQCSLNNNVRGTSHDGVNEKDNLGSLLNRIFHGETTYETICMRCGKKSVRSEGFMDLNLPIVQCDTEDHANILDDIESNSEAGNSQQSSAKRQRKKKGQIEKAFEKQRKRCSVDTNVQYCFDQYTKAEILDGENQYFCDACNSKQDAKRVMSLTDLPPVLNIQLSRYVFDREKFVKKKLSDKVRLPTILTVDKHGDGASGTALSCSTRESSKKKYLLCAVMRHQGTSAYSGHYVAEAMDWTTGQWYEFNDETVKVLSAPSNSYIPERSLETEDDRFEDAIRFPGSQDAYNMYYVDEEYLGENALSTMIRNQRLNAKQIKTKTIEPEEADVLNDLIRERVNRFSCLTELCHDDYRTSNRLRRRKDGIRKYMLVDSSSLLLQESQTFNDKEQYFWVDGQTLRHFLACDRSLDSKLRSDEQIVCPNSLLCRHGCLHPRDARRGKLLRKSLYDSYTSLLSGERKLLSATNQINESDVIGCIITPKGGLTCEDCSKIYRNELSTKLEILKNVNDLYLDIVDEATDALKCAKLNPARDNVQHDYSYIVARSTITKFKKLVIDLMKSVANFAKGVCLDSRSVPSNTEDDVFLGGIDDLDLSSFPGSPTYKCCGGSNSTESQLDVKFNSKITCPHGNCCDFNLRIVRYVPYKTWAKIKKVFPEAIEHKVLISTEDGKVRKPNVEEDGCTFCRKEKDAIKNLTFDVESWAKKTRQNFSLKKLLDEKKISVGEIAFHNFDCAQNNCRLVHRDDIANLCKSVRLLGRLSKLKIPENVEMKTHIENMAFPSYHSVVLDFEKQPNARLLQSLRSLICCEHKRVIRSAIIDASGKDEKLQLRYQLSNSIAVLSDEEYNAYINSLAELLIILNNDYQKENNTEEDLLGNSSPLFDDVKKHAASCHPAITRTAGGCIQCDEVLLFSIDGNSKEFSIVPGICDHETCKKDYVPIIQKNAGVIVESVSVDSTDTGELNKDASRKMDGRIGSIAASPIIVESDIEDYMDTSDKTQKIRVFRYKADSDLTDALQSLRAAVGLPAGDMNQNLNFQPRRSSRKRKAKFPVGCITHEDIISIGLHQNVAALRLLLYQNCQIPLSCKLSIAILSDDDSSSKSLEIAFDRSKTTLYELIDELETVELNPHENFFVLYQADEVHKNEDIETTLMDSLLQISSIESPDSKFELSKKGKARRRSSERGFQGTLLQSSSAISVPVNEDKDDNDLQNAVRRPRSNTIISDDEIDEIPTQHMKEIISDSSDGEVAIVPSQEYTRCKKIGDGEKMKLVAQLIEITASKDENACFEAVSWAIKSNPEYGGADVIDAALAKFFDGTTSY